MPQTCPCCIRTTPSLGSGPFFISCSHTLTGLPLSSIAWRDAGTRTVHTLAPWKHMFTYECGLCPSSDWLEPCPLHRTGGSQRVDPSPFTDLCSRPLLKICWAQCRAEAKMGLKCTSAFRVSRSVTPKLYHHHCKNPYAMPTLWEALLKLFIYEARATDLAIYEPGDKGT